MGWVLEDREMKRGGRINGTFANATDIAFG